MPGQRAEGRITPTVAADAVLWEAAKARARAEGLPLSTVVSVLLRRWLDGQVTIDGGDH